MIKSAHMGTEINVTVVNKIGVLADLSNTVLEDGVNIEAVAGYAVNNEARIMLVTSDNRRTVAALKKAAYTNISEKPVIVIELENKPGVLKELTADLARQNIDIVQIYGTTCAANCPAKVVLSTNNNEKALGLFRKQP